MSLVKETNKPTPEAKALSLYLMAYKSTSPAHKEQSKRMNKLWSMVRMNDMSKSDYLEEVQNVLESYGGYDTVVEQTVRFYIKKTGEWKLKGDDQYCQDAQEIADKVLQE